MSVQFTIKLLFSMESFHRQSLHLYSIHSPTFCPGLPVLTVTPDQTEFWDGQTNVIIKCETTETTFTSLALQKDNEEPEVVAINNVQVRHMFYS